MQGDFEPGANEHLHRQRVVVTALAKHSSAPARFLVHPRRKAPRGCAGKVRSEIRMRGKRFYYAARQPASMAAALLGICQSDPSIAIGELAVQAAPPNILVAPY
jgi:hypothetical protein